MRYFINRGSDTLVYEAEGRYYPYTLTQREEEGSVFETDDLGGSVGHLPTAFGPLEEAKSTWDWLEEFPLLILDPDGWRGVNELSFDALITRREFAERVYISTVQHGSALKRLLEIENPVKWTADR